MRSGQRRCGGLPGGNQDVGVGGRHNGAHVTEVHRSRAPHQKATCPEKFDKIPCWGSSPGEHGHRTGVSRTEHPLAGSKNSADISMYSSFLFCSSGERLCVVNIYVISELLVMSYVPLYLRTYRDLELKLFIIPISAK